MRYLTKGALILLAAFCFAAISPTIRADQWNKKTYVTTNAPIEIPGKVLPAGTYTFQLLDSISDRNIVQILNKDQSHLFATIITVPDYRLQPTGHTVIKFAETPAGDPPALRAWFYPGDRYGQQFVYPKSRAVELAKQSNQSVLSMADTMTSEISKPIKSNTDAAAVALEKTPLKAEKPNGQEVGVDQVVGKAPHTTSKPSGDR